MVTKKINKETAVKAGNVAKRPKTGRVGSPAFVFDADQVEVFGMYSATYETMAEYYGVSIDTIARRMKAPSGQFCRAYKKGQGLGLMNLRKAQMEKALSGDSTMLIWLGKQLLGQRDQAQNDIKLDQSIKLVVDEDDLNA